MKTHVYLSGVVAALIGLGGVRGQGPAASTFATSAAPPVIANNRSAANNVGPQDPGTLEMTQPGGPPIYGPGLSDWIMYPRPSNCCGPIGKHGPIASEVYARTGVTFLTGGGLVGDNGRAGYNIGGGLRTLLYSREDAAWVVDIGLTSSWHDIINSPPAVLNNVEVLTPVNNNVQRMNVPQVTVIASSIHYLLPYLTLGRELYLWGGPDCGDESKCRVGWDAGGIWGSSKMIAAPTSLMQGQQFRHRTDVVGGIKVALHGDVEYPTGCCILFIGGRIEYGAIWSDILQSQNDTNTQMVSFLVNFGLRF
jgi:hypothetical protein